MRSGVSFFSELNFAFSAGIIPSSLPWKSSRMLGRSVTGDSITAMAGDVFDSFLINLAVSNSLNTSYERIINPRDKQRIESNQTEICY